ncbi:hypothetical protein ABZ826_35605 [Streptomyces sp. NPDC047515]|uniref:hypothetical protein n=1 Tax=Streptomyces sp. NPDC047515 TaxID=3155380 RepID=UPI0033FCAF58
MANSSYFQEVAKKHAEHVRGELRDIGRRMKPLVEAGTARNELLIADSNFGIYPDDHETCRVKTVGRAATAEPDDALTPIATFLLHSRARPHAVPVSTR